MKSSKRFLAGLLAISMVVASLAGCSSSKSTTPSSPSVKTESTVSSNYVSGQSSLTGKRVRTVIGSTSTSGDSYMIADIVTRYLAKEMGFNGKVDPIGNSKALDAMQTSKGDGLTMMMFHDMAFMSVLFGAVSDKYALENMTVGPRVGQNPGACFGAKTDAPYSSLTELSAYLAKNTDKKVRINIEAGGFSHIAYVAYYLWTKEKYGEDVAKRLQVIVGGTTAEKLQIMWDGNADVIYGDVSAFQQYTKDGVDAKLKMKIFDSCDSVTGNPIKSMQDDGITFDGKTFDFTKDFYMFFPKNMDASVLAEYEQAMTHVAANPDFQKAMEKLMYKAVSDTSVNGSNKYILEKRATAQKIITLAPNLDTLTVTK